MPIHGYASFAAKKRLQTFSYDPGELQPMEVEIAITHCGICHSDVHLVDDVWGITQFPFIPGHEVVGTVRALGSAVTLLTKGQRVAVGWQAGACGECEWCLQGEDHLCDRSQPTCVRHHGGFADAVR